MRHFTSDDIEKVARELLGEPNRRSTRTELRFDTGTYGTTVCIAGKKAGSWFDHDADKGGKMLDLIARQTGNANGEAFDWLRGVGIEPDPQTARREVAAYDYTDADGGLLFQVVRYEPKDFRQRRPDGGGWIWNVKGIETVPYRLPDLVKAPLDKTIYVVEGERDVDALRRLGLTATCNPGGKLKWPAHFARWFAGRRVAAIPDNDADGGGLRHARDVAAKLKGVAASVAVTGHVEVGKDVSDWIAAGADRAAIERLVAETLDGAEPPAETDILEGLTDPTKLAGIEPPAREWIVQDWLPVGSVTSLYGRGGVGKTLLAQQIQTAVGTGQPFFGLETIQCKVLSFFCEDDEAELHRRQICINASLGVGMEDLGGIRWQGRFGKANIMATVEGGILKPTEFRAFVREAAVQFGARLLILDNVAQLFAGNENIRADVTQFVNDLGAIAQEIDGAVLLLGHPGKADGSEYSGSTGWDAAVRSRWILERPKEDAGEDNLAEQDAGELANRRVLRKAKANYSGTGDEITMRWQEGAFRVEGAPKFKDTVDRIEERVQEKTDDAAFLKCLDALTAQGRNVSHSPYAHNYAPKAMGGKPETKGITKKRLKQAMERQFAAGVIVVGTFGRGTDRKPIPGIVRAGCGEPAEGLRETCGEAFDEPATGCGVAQDDCGIVSANPLKSERGGSCGEPAGQRGEAPANPLKSEGGSCGCGSPLYTTYIEGDAHEAASPSEDDTVETAAQDGAIVDPEPTEPDLAPSDATAESVVETVSNPAGKGPSAQDVAPAPLPEQIDLEEYLKDLDSREAAEPDRSPDGGRGPPGAETPPPPPGFALDLDEAEP